MKSTILVPLFVLLVAGAQAQQCNCKTSFEWVKKTFEENDAGYAHIVKLKGPEAYKLHNQLIAEKVQHITDVDSCIGKLQDWVRFFRTDHFRFTKTAETAPQAGFKVIHDNRFSPEQFKQYLKQSADSIEGIWESPGYTIAVQKQNNGYRGIVMAATVANWKPGDVKFDVAADFKTATRYNQSTAIVVKKIQFFGKGKSILQLDNFFLKRSTADAAANEYYRLKTSPLPFGYKRDSNTVYVHINSFNYENKVAIDSVLKSLHTVITSTPNLIIDLRDCQGGTDESFSNLVPYIYTNPIRSVMAEFYSTPRNNQMWKDVANREGLDPEEKKTYQQIAELMNSKLGEYVNIFGKDVEVTTRAKVLPYPQSIGIIIHENNFSTTEEFILKAKQSKKVKFFGRKTGGALDVSNMVEAKEPGGNFIFEYCISRSLRIPEFPVDDMGLHPDFYLDRAIPETEWVDYTAMILNAK
ncbi:S41 family peptidase [Chitinophaga sp.]|uniref:S41 family peptidase n=1 Tax=Chitinophaga sp. TaxID=1869181 RepID=UPI0031D98C25